MAVPGACHRKLGAGADNRGVRTTGIHYRDGSLLLATVEIADDGVTSTVGNAKVTIPGSLSEATALTDLSGRVRQHLASYGPNTAGIVETRKYNSWVYRSVYSRVFAVCATFVAASDLNIPCTTVGTEAIARSVNVKPQALQDLDWSTLGFTERPTHWKAGLADAYACAIHLGVPATGPSR